MLRKICQFVFGLCVFAGFMFMIGTAGASDCEVITFSQSIKQSIIALVLMAVGCFGLKLSDYEYID